MRPQLLPLLMLALAALACDGGISYNTIYVAAVEADSALPGHVRVIVRQMVGSVPENYTADDDTTTFPSTLTESDTYFASTDYGQTWTTTDPFEPSEHALDPAWGGDSLHYQGQTLWTLPRS